MFRTVYPLAVKLIATSEGISGLGCDGRFYPYHVKADPPGVMTIYRGHKVRPGEDFSKGLTALEGEELFNRDVAEHSVYIQNDIGAGVKISDWMYGAFASFTYNLGKRIFATDDCKAMVNMMRESRFTSAVLRMHRFSRSGGVYRDGLFYRRLVETYLALTGKLVKQPHDCKTALDLITLIEKLPTVQGNYPVPIRQFFLEHHVKDLCQTC